jgi:hypothetical protein
MNIELAYKYAWRHAVSVCAERGPQWAEDVAQELVTTHVLDGRPIGPWEAWNVFRRLACYRYKRKTFYTTLGGMEDNTPEVYYHAPEASVDDRIYCRELLLRARLNTAQRDAAARYVEGEVLRVGSDRHIGQRWHRAKEKIRRAVRQCAAIDKARLTS